MQVDTRLTFRVGAEGSNQRLGKSYQATWLDNKPMEILQPKDTR
jgi:hypothetical protein